MNISHKGRYHIILVTISILALSITIAFANQDLNSSMSSRSNIMNITPGDAYALIHNSSSLVIIDVRTPLEYQSGRLDGAINLDYYSDGFLNNLTSLDKNSTYLIYCRRGVRGGLASGMMKDLGFREVYNIAGGLTQWVQEGRSMIGEVI